ncbi:hypothetical protein ACQCZE_22020 [Escherichia coli]|uniref:hypothetical protein n=1 Tax=Escherichia coli TaxID=562 RepID=UPI003CEFACE5
MAEETVQNPRSLIQQINIQISPKCCSLELALSHVESWVTFRRTVHPRFPVNISPVIVVALENEDLTHDLWQRIRGRIPQYVNVMGVLLVSDTEAFESHPLCYADVVVTDNPMMLERMRAVLTNPVRTEILINIKQDAS